MLHIRPVTAILSASILALMAGCSQEQPTRTAPDRPPVRNEDPGTVTEPTEPQIHLSLVPPDNPDPATNAQIQQYLNGLAAKGHLSRLQGVWIQSGNTLLANHQGTVPLPAASVTKVATTLAALDSFGPDHRFVTLISATGPIYEGVLQGDLVVRGGEDPFFVWEDAIALGNLLNQLGIRRVAGNLIIVGEFYMNFEIGKLTSGKLLQQALNYQNWSAEVETQYRTLPPDTPRPQVIINGGVQFDQKNPANAQTLVRHYSFPLAELLKKMNRYSNNLMADMLANTVGGASQVALKAADRAGVPRGEIKLVNGSGLGVANQISPRAAVAMFLAIERYLQPHNMTVADLFAIVGQDEGILDTRPRIPQLAVVKSGSLNNVSTLAGALPTREQGTVWFAIMNFGNDLVGFRAEQESLLQTFVKHWGAVSSLPPELQPLPQRQNQTSRSEIAN